MISSFEFLKVKNKKHLQDLKDEELVKIAQSDMDKYRSQCNWSCPKCDKKVSYLDSLSITGEKYIHEIRACNLNISCDSSLSCKKKMNLKSLTNNDFESEAFEELFARYQKWIVHESEKSKSIDSPEEIYGELCAAFSKVVGMFAREGDFSKVSEKWFSSFFYKSIQNKISDIQKTNNYQKRSPLIKCEVCGEYLGKITSKHLVSEGHNYFIKKLYIDIGKQRLSESGEIYYYNNNEELEKRAIIVGATYLFKLDIKERDRKIKSMAIPLYFNLYPNSKLKNNLFSTNVPMDEEENANTIEDINCESVTSTVFKNVIDDIYIDETVEFLVNILYGENSKHTIYIDKMFRKEDLSLSKKRIILKEILLDKMSFNGLKNSELDRSYSAYVRTGFTSKILQMIKSDKTCRMELLSLKNK